MLAGQYNSLPVDKPSEVVVVNYNDHNGDNDYDDAATSLGYGATEVPAEVFTSGATDSEDDYAEVERLLLHCLENFVSREKFRELLNEFRLKLGNEPKSRIQAWVLRQCDHRGLRVVGSRPCTRRHGLYRADVHVTPYEGKTSPCHACSKWVTSLPVRPSAPRSQFTPCCRRPLRTKLPQTNCEQTWRKKWRHSPQPRSRNHEPGSDDI